MKKLTKKERDTLWALVNYPTLNDKGLAKKTRLKLSTVTAIRRRLRERGYYYTVNIPNFYRLGHELLTIEYGTFNEAVPIEDRIEHFKNFVNQEANTIFSVMSRSSGILFNVTKNYAEASEHYERLEMLFTSHHLADEGSWKKVIFPFQTSMFWNFFNFSPVIRYAFDIKRKINLPEFSSDKKAEVLRLSKKEKRVLYGLVKYPEESDNHIADRFGVSRQAVSSIKKRFVREDLISTQRIMNFEMIKCNLLTYGYTFFGPKSPIEMRTNGIEYTKNNVPVFIGISSNFENVVFAASRTYSDYDRLREKLLAYYKSHLSMARQPETVLFPVQDLCYCKKLAFHELLGDMMDIEDK